MFRSTTGYENQLRVDVAERWKDGEGVVSLDRHRGADLQIKAIVDTVFEAPSNLIVAGNIKSSYAK